jgi:hypothetical protein
VPATPVGDGHWTATVDEVRAGPTDVTVVVHREGVDDTTWHEQWVVGTSSPGRQPVVSMAPVSGLLRWTALGLGLVLAAAWGRRLTRRVRRSRGTATKPGAGDSSPATERTETAGSPV